MKPVSIASQTRVHSAQGEIIAELTRWHTEVESAEEALSHYVGMHRYEDAFALLERAISWCIKALGMVVVAQSDLANRGVRR